MTTQIYNVGGFTLEADGITVPEAGVYQVTSNCYMRVSGTAQRPSVGTRFDINGVEQDEIAAMGYIRNSNTSHESTSVSLTTILVLNANDKVNILFGRRTLHGLFFCRVLTAR